MIETTEKCLQARYARTISKVAIFLVKSDTVHLHYELNNFQILLLEVLD